MSTQTHYAGSIIRTAEIILGPEDRFFKEVTISEDGSHRIERRGVVFPDGTTREASFCITKKFEPKEAPDGRILVDTIMTRD